MRGEQRRQLSTSQLAMRELNSRIDQAELELAFNTPGTLHSWAEVWLRPDIPEGDLQNMLWQWV